MKKIFFMAVISSPLLNAASWQEIINKHQALLLKPEYSLILEQFEAVSIATAPTVAAPCIKSILIVENNERVIDLRNNFHPRIAMMPDAPSTKPFFDSMYNSGLPSASKMRLDIYKKLERVLIHLDELAPRFGYKRGTISIKVFEGLRDLQTQKMLFDNKLEEIKQQNPLFTHEQAEAETSKWVSPYKNNVPVHSTGAAVDIRLWNSETNDFVDLGKFGVIWGANPNAPTFSENISDEQKLNRLYLLMAATRAGLVNYCFEFWHYSAGDRYATFWQEPVIVKRIAKYGAV